jgi:hypothetical protein
VEGKFEDRFLGIARFALIPFKSPHEANSQHCSCLFRKSCPNGFNVELVFRQSFRLPFASFRFKEVAAIDVQCRC